MVHEPLAESKSTVRRVALPPLEFPSPQEIHRRRILFERAMVLRAEIGPIGINTDELVHQAREEADARDS
ncbi:MAG: hypothetical protein ACRDJH_09010 [Thermomicrobiales bacterium]